MSVKLVPLLKDKVAYFRNHFVAVKNGRSDIDEKVPFNFVLPQYTCNSADSKFSAINFAPNEAIDMIFARASRERFYVKRKK